MREKKYYVYILTNRSKTLYIGFTGNLAQRMWQHKHHVFPGFTDRYHIDRLVWFETYSNVHAAITREKQIKGWTRARKMTLVVASNPTWRDLSENWSKSIHGRVNIDSNCSTNACHSEQPNPRRGLRPE